MSRFIANLEKALSQSKEGRRQEADGRRGEFGKSLNSSQILFALKGRTRCLRKPQTFQPSVEACTRLGKAERGHQSYF